ncbi:unnamed protein product [Protopolystoma xenopodis]|uniref:DDHD domain-containing protein n=1 Tax=Protopolystoma xenopodis TaxID=117903 RepID=A0A3S5A4C8_9PLAT|nr:unnamed protein product [Protopolystoma xenopodis]
MISKSLSPASDLDFRLACEQAYNIFHLNDPFAFRVEPLLEPKFVQIPPIHIPQFSRYPLGDARSLSLVETFLQKATLFSRPFGSTQTGFCSNGASHGISAAGAQFQHKPELNNQMACQAGVYDNNNYRKYKFSASVNAVELLHHGNLFGFIK